MQPSGGPPPTSPLPASPLPPTPDQVFNPTPSGSPFPASLPPSPSAAPPPRRKRLSNLLAVLFVVVILVVILAATGELDFLFSPSDSSASQAAVKITNTSASHRCPASGTPTETFLFTLVNTGSVNASATIGFYLNDAQVTSGTYLAAVGSSTPYTVTTNLASCPPSGSTYYLELVSVTVA